MKGVLMVPLILREVREQLFRAALVANEVVVDEEDVSGAQRPQRIELAPDLVHALGTRLPAEHDDDVAELALEGTPARELHTHGLVPVDLEEVEAGEG